MTPPTLPIDPGELAGHVARLWRIETERAGVDPTMLCAVVDRDGVVATDIPPGVEDVRAAVRYERAADVVHATRRALFALADALEDECGLVVAREGRSFRVLGFAAAPQIVMVDELMQWPTKIRCFKAGSCHLMTDGPDLDPLHALASRIGMRRSWFQEGSTPHYDLTPARREDALAAGAVFVPWREQAQRRIDIRKGVRSAASRLIDLDPRDPRAVAWRDEMLRARLARAAAAAGPADAPGMRSRGEAARVRAKGAVK